ncbi:glycoside hydrolase family 16 protein [Collybiopsis luxurians FD-317 M1]|uniref:Glycoside hydrolase family 16 protein n=1 Tax=Collybiopsis luxurians FD-317 M1 TaxID=944289 RepID=A0A0D0BYT3_9AGAR|nr:glycoside hydrolase family 16 protein [Collybiopsis luxurians FD-317 M1]
MTFSYISLVLALFLHLPLLSSAAPIWHEHYRQLTRRGSYTLSKSYEGDTFFDNMKFFSDTDPTHGFVDYQTKEEAMNKGLAKVEDGVVILAVDSTTTLDVGTNRSSVRVSSTDTYNGGLFIYDIAKMPVGPTTWPAIWSTAEANWPDNGEIDVIEGTTESTGNQITMHTGAGCTLTTGQAITGTTVDSELTCESGGSNNNGCPTKDPDTSSFGAGFNSAGGGVFAELWDPSVGIKVWRWSQGSVPEDITSKSPDPSSWGNPVSFIPNGQACGIADHFKDHNIIIGTYLPVCGDWAGATYSGTGTCQEAVAVASNYVDAQWKINSIRVYQTS